MAHTRPKKVLAFLLLGSNEGDRLHLLESAALELATAGVIIRSSSVYETEAWGKRDQPEFLNQVVELETALSPGELLKTLQTIEDKLGRKRNEKWGPRTLDIDLLFYGNAVISKANLIVPHPDIAQRRFVLVPLAEIAAEFVHPVLRETVRKLLVRCTDILHVEKLV